MKGKKNELHTIGKNLKTNYLSENGLLLIHNQTPPQTDNCVIVFKQSRLSKVNGNEAILFVYYIIPSNLKLEDERGIERKIGFIVRKNLKKLGRVSDSC